MARPTHRVAPDLTKVSEREGHEIPEGIQLLRESLHQQLKDARLFAHDFSDLRPDVKSTDPVH